MPFLDTFWKTLTKNFKGWLAENGFDKTLEFEVIQKYTTLKIRNRFALLFES